MSGGAPTDPYFKNVVLLLHGDGTNGGQNNTFIDGSTNNFTITRNGNPTQGSFNPYGTFWSNYFDGQYSYLGIADNVNLRPGAGAFTIEAWIYRNAAGAAHTIFAKGGSSTGIVFQVTSSNTLQFTHTTTNITSTGTIAAYTWTHVAVVREGTGTNQTKLYINGTADGQGTVSTDFTQTNGVHIGTNRSLGEDFRGYISNLRFVKGTAVYTGNFTPPSANLTAISNTSLLTCQSNRLVDNSTNNFAFTITYSGVTSFAPFAPKSAYTTAQGGSGYFDGSGDSVVTPSSSSLSFGTGDFSVEAWFYIISGDSIISNLTQLASPGDYGTLINWNGGSVLALLKADNANQLTLTSSVVANANGWNHVAFVRTGTTVSLYLNGSRVATGTSSITSLTDKFKIGGVYASNSSGDYKGYVTDLRVYKGAGPYNATSSSITVPTAPLTTSSNPSLLMNFTNAAIFDSAAKNDLETVGNAQIDTGTKKFGTGSLEFDGTGDWLLVPDNADLQLGPGNLTIEFWVYLATGNAGSNRGLVGKGTGSTKWSVSLDTTQKVVFSYGTSTLTSSGAITLDAWNHIAVVREGTGTNQTKIYINGTNDGTGTVSTDFTPINPLYIGANGSAGDPMKGFIDELRITKGVARYTANFTPPALPFPNK
jgi:hypothetical protein